MVRREEIKIELNLYPDIDDTLTMDILLSTPF